MNPSFNLKELVKSPKFSVVKDKDIVYFGEVENEMKNGKGISVTEKDIFEGEYKDNVKYKGY